MTSGCHRFRELRIAKATVCLVTITAMYISSCSSSQPMALTHEGNGKQQSMPLETVAARVLPGPPSSSTGGFDGSRAFEHVRHLVELRPRPPGSDAIHHYDTVRLPNFVGADDGGSGTGTMLELARVLCSRKSKLNTWIIFFDGEEAQGQWADKSSIQWTKTNNTFGSREMAARMAVSGELKKVKAMILADMIGPSNLKIKRDIVGIGTRQRLGFTVDPQTVGERFVEALN